MSSILAKALFKSVPTRVHKTDDTCSAEVIKAEHPTRGDDTRVWGPPFAPYTEESGLEGPGEAAYFFAASILHLTIDYHVHHCEVSG